MQPVPGPIELCCFSLCETLDPEILQDAVENHSMKMIEVGPGHLARPHKIHLRLVLSAPGVCEFRSVDGEAFSLRQPLYFQSDGRSPVDDCAERVEDRRFDGL